MKNKLMSFILAMCLSISCGIMLTACGDNAPPETPHTHEWVEESWEKDSSGHWHKCKGCSSTTTKLVHTYTNNTCSVCGYIEEQELNLPVESIARDLEIISMATVAGGVANLVKLPDGKNMLIGVGADDFDAEFNLDGVLYEDEITTIDYLVFTSTSDIRIGGADMLFDYDYDIKNLYRPIVSNGLNPSESFNTAISMAQQKGCTIRTIEETNCDIDYKFRDYSGNVHHYKVDFMMPVDFDTATNIYDATIVVSIQYQGKTIILGGDATVNNIDGYCLKYNNVYDADVLVSNYLMNQSQAIGASENRGTKYLEKISLEAGDYFVGVANNGTTSYEVLTGVLSYLGENLKSIKSDAKDTAIITVTHSAVISVVTI